MILIRKIDKDALMENMMQLMDMQNGAGAKFRRGWKY